MSARSVLSVLLFVAAAAFADPVVTVRVMCPEARLAAAPMGAYAGDVIGEIARHYGWQLVPAKEVAEADLLAPSFYTRGFRRDFDFIKMPIGAVSAEGGDRNCFLAVRRTRPELFRQVTEEYERLCVDRPELFDGWRERRFGKKPPARRVRVGRYFEPGFCDLLEDGALVGANEDHIARIAELSGWDVEWVPGGYNRLLEDLRNGSIDVLAGVTVSEDRSRDYLFPQLPTGMFRTHLFARRTAPYEDSVFSRWSGAVIGTGPGDPANTVLRDYLRENHIDCEVREYASSSEAVLGYFRGECQILHSVGLHTLVAEKILHTFPPVPAFVVVSRQRKDLFAEVCKAMSRISVETPGFEETVENRHFLARRSNAFFLTAAEHRYLRRRIAAGSPVMVEISPTVDLLKEWNSDTQNAGGFVHALAEELARRTGIAFFFLPPADAKTVRSRYEHGEFDLWATYNADISGLPLRYDPLESLTLSRVLVCRRSTRFSDQLPERVAVSKLDYERFRSGHEVSISGATVYDTLEDCIKAVMDGKADCTTCPSSRAMTMLRWMDPEGKLEIRPVGERLRRVPFQFVFSPKCDPELVSIVTKAVASLDSDDVESCMAGTLSEFAREELPTTLRILPFVAAFVGAVLLIVGVLVFRRARRAQAEVDFRARATVVRNDLLIRGVKSLKTSAEIVSSRAEFLRNPGIRREQALGWTEEILRQAEEMLARLQDIRQEVAGHGEQIAKLRKISGGGGRK